MWLSMRGVVKVRPKSSLGELYFLFSAEENRGGGGGVLEESSFHDPRDI